MNLQSGDAGDLSVKALSRGSWPSSAHESRLWRDGVTSFSCSGTSPGLPLARNRVFRSRATVAPPSWQSCLPKPLLQRNEHLDVLGNVASPAQRRPRGARRWVVAGRTRGNGHGVTLYTLAADSREARFHQRTADLRLRLFSIIPNPVRRGNCELCVVGYNAIRATSAWM
jgi:hypothetical protein